MSKLTENEMARIAALTWSGQSVTQTSTNLALPIAAVKAYRDSDACLARLKRISAYYAQAEQEEGGGA